MRNKCLLLALAASFILMAVVGCTEENPTLSVPDYIRGMGEVNPGSGEITARLYLDNTHSMWGYANKKGSAYIRAMDFFYVKLGGYKNHEFNALNRDWTGLDWVTFSKEKEGDFKSGFVSEGFYTDVNMFFKGDQTAKKLGPLQTLIPDLSAAAKAAGYEGVVFNSQTLNIFITDLAEQNVENIALAKNLIDISGNQEDCSISVFRVMSGFSGLASVPDPDNIDQNGNRRLINENYDSDSRGARPFFCIMIGPTEELKDLEKALDEYLKPFDGRGDTAVKNDPATQDGQYNKISFYAKRGLQKTKFSDVITLESETIAYEEYNPQTANRSVNFTKLDQKALFPNASIVYRCLNFLWDSAGSSKDNKKSGTVHLVVPLKDLADNTSAAQTDDLRYYVDVGGIKVYRSQVAQKSDLPSAQSSSESESAPPIGDSQYEWKEVTYYDYKDFLVVEPAKYLKTGDEIPLVNTEKVLELYPKTGLPKSNAFYENGAIKTVYRVDAPSGALHLIIRLNNVSEIEQILKASALNHLSVRVPVVADNKTPPPMPPWITGATFKRNLAEGTQRVDALCQTTVLFEDFVKYLSGTAGSVEEQKQYWDLMRQTVADVAVNFSFAPKK
ncbi:MAG: hypothetical protein LBQ48_02480 [Oscillospiraceae bacterium]|nr:hypothetical protein [Oscillospiraceae bacterium]